MIAAPPRVRQEFFGRTNDGQDVTCYTLEHATGTRLEVLDYGAIVRSLYVRAGDDRAVDVVLGYDDLGSYEQDSSYLGAAIGRYANRIRNGAFTLDGTTYHLSTNDGPHHLHGGERGYNKAVWRSRPFETHDAASLMLEHSSADGDQGYPGRLTARITYGISASGVFSVEYRATADRPTPVNLTHHSYFNLSGEGNGDVLGHELTINAALFTGIDSDLLPTGHFARVEGTPLDFRRATPVGARIDESDDQLNFAGGYDHNFVLADARSTLTPAARVFARATGLAMEVFTTEPGLQFYSGNFLDAVRPGKHGHRYGRRSGLCLETQHFPDSPNHPEFPSTILRPGHDLRSRTEYRFYAH